MFLQSLPSIDFRDIKRTPHREDKTATTDGGAGPIEGKWYIKDGYIFIDREEKADLMAKIPNGDFNSITLEQDPNSHDGKWR